MVVRKHKYLVRNNSFFSLLKVTRPANSMAVFDHLPVCIDTELYQFQALQAKHQITLVNVSVSHV
jgi:hypothetical protein